MSVIRAGAYYRISKDKDTSIDRQRSAVESEFGTDRYHVVQEYIDSNQSGWKDDREAFQRLISDAQTGKFQAVLCLDQDRFSRFPPMEANHYWHLLDKAGVEIHTVAQGVLRFDDLADWLTASINQHGKLQYCKDISLKSTNALLSKAKQGLWPGGPTPFGYIVGSDGKLTFGLVDEMSLVRHIFSECVAGKSLSQIAQQLNEEGLTTRAARQWRGSRVHAILKNRVYAGDFLWNQKTRGQFTAVRKGKVETQFERGRNDESE